VARGLSLVSLILALAVGAWILSSYSGRSAGGHTPAQQIDEAQQAATGVAFRQAQVQLEQHRALDGTYAGASVESSGVALVRADASSYCLEARSGSSTTHMNGPDGAPAPGPC
jgi:hypothetical protein